MDDSFKQPLRAFVVGFAPVVLAAGFFTHPYVSDLTDADELAAAVERGSTRWAWSHILIAVGVVLLILAVFAIRLFLRSAGEDDWSFWATGLTTVGAGLLLALTGLDGLGGYAAAQAEGSTAGFFEAAADWEWLFLTSFALFSLGLIALATAVRVSRVLGSTATWVVVVALIVAAVANFIPSFWAAYLISVVAIIGFWALAAAILSHRPATPNT